MIILISGEGDPTGDSGNLLIAVGNTREQAEAALLKGDGSGSIEQSFDVSSSAVLCCSSYYGVSCDVAVIDDTDDDLTRCDCEGTMSRSHTCEDYLVWECDKCESQALEHMGEMSDASWQWVKEDMRANRK